MSLRQEKGLGNDIILLDHKARSSAALLARRIIKLTIDGAIPRDAAISMIRNLGIELSTMDNPSRYAKVEDDQEEVGNEEERVRESIVRVHNNEEVVMEHYIGEKVIQRWFRRG
ncbi:MAG: hypothetical protein ACP5NY_02075 [Thermocladium sp.]